MISGSVCTDRDQITRGPEFLEPLFADMTQEDPAKRPKIDEAVARLDEVMKTIGAWHLRGRVIHKRLPVTRDFVHFVRRVVWTIMRTPALPAPKSHTPKASCPTSAATVALASGDAPPPSVCRGAQAGPDRHVPCDGVRNIMRGIARTLMRTSA